MVQEYPAASPVAPTRPSGHFPSLTGIRAVAAVWVVLFHGRGVFHEIVNPDKYTAGKTSGWYDAIMRHGHFGVPLFFALSGFLITYAYVDRFAALGFRAYGEYYVRRVARIVPVYLAILAIRYAVYWHRGDLNFDPFVTLMHLTFTQAWFDDVKTTGISSAWSLTLEEAFYCTIPLLFSLLAVLSKRGRWATVFAVLATFSGGLFLIGFVLTLVAPHPYGFMASTSHLVQVTYLGRSAEFLVGVFAGLYVLRKAEPRREPPSVSVVNASGTPQALTRGSSWFHSHAASELATWAVFAAIFSVPLVLPAHEEYYERAFASFVIAALGAMLFMLLALRSSTLSRIFGSPFVVYLGKISFALYLVHPTHILMNFSYKYSAYVTSNPSVHFWLYLGLLLCVANGLAAIFYEVIERPCQKWITKRWIKKRL